MRIRDELHAGRAARRLDGAQGRDAVSTQRIEVASAGEGSGELRAVRGRSIRTRGAGAARWDVRQGYDRSEVAPYREYGDIGDIGRAVHVARRYGGSRRTVALEFSWGESRGVLAGIMRSAQRGGGAGAYTRSKK